MDFVSNQQPQINEMLKVLGVSDIKDLLTSIPKSLLVDPPKEDDGLSEFEGKELFEKIASENSIVQFDKYLGCGAYEHHVPAITPFIISKSGFLTAYTPYQAEVSQGVLQTIFEFQSVLCRLTGLEVANASLYDGASACAEALMMAMRINPKRKKVLVAKNLHPNYRAVIEQYLGNLGIEIVNMPMMHNGCLDFNRAEKLYDDTVCAQLLSYPNFFGGVEDYSPLIKKAKEFGIINILSSNPMVFGLFKSAKDLDVDISVGDCQPFGIPLQFGGPYSGYICAKKKYVRQLPGRIVGKTTDASSKEGFVLTLQTREQHIRREKATSNICSNQALCALASLVTMLWYGPKGIKDLALANYQRANLLKSELNKLLKVEMLNEQTIFNEFTIKLDMPVEKVLHHFRLYDIEPGIALNRYHSDMGDGLIIAVTETKNENKLDKYLEVAKKLLD